MKIKEKPTMGKPKAKAPGVLNPKQAARLMKEKYLQQLDQRPEGPENETGYATGQVEGAGRWAVDELTVAADPRAGRPRRARMKEKPAVGTEQAPQGAEGLPAGENRRNGQYAQGGERPANAPKERGGPGSRRQQQPPGAGQRRTAATGGRAEAPVIKERGVDHRTHPEPGRAPAQGPGTAPASSRSADPRQAQRRSALNNRRRGAPAASHPPTTGTGPRAGQGAPLTGGGRRAGGSLKERAPTRTLKARDTARRVAKAGRVTPKPRPPAVRPAAKLTARKTRQQAQRQLARRMTAQTVKAAKTAAVAVKRVTVAVVKAAAALVSAVAGIVGGGVLLVALVVIIIIAAVANSPFGLFFAEERNAPDTVSVAEAVAQVNMAYNARLEELQAGGYDGIVIHGQAPDWPDVLAVFAVKLAGADAGGMDVATLDADRVEKLTAVFWDMTAITTEVETIDHPGDGEGEGWTEYILHITITPKTADDMRTAYAFTAYQNSALDELLADWAALSALAGSLAITSADVREVLDALPADLSPQRRAAVETALSLVGKVNYFWGGKSYVIGWDSRWGRLTKVWAEGSSSTGTYRPYGLDCTGFLDWSFRNAGLRSDGHWYIGTNLNELDWADALPGDIALFPDASHVGLVVGRSESGGILVAHCSSGQNNVVITDCAATGFTAIGRPDIYGD